MKRIFLWLWLIIKRQLNYKFVPVFLVLLPLSVLIVSNIPRLNESSAPRVGLYLPDNDALSAACADILTSGQYEAIEYYIADSADELKNDISSKDTDCGYVFPENMTQILSSGNYRSSIALLASPSSVMDALSSEMVFNALFQCMGKEIALNYIKENSAFAEIQKPALDYADRQFDYYVNGPATFHVEFQTLDVSSQDADSPAVKEYNANNSVFPLRGILSILVYIAGMSGSVLWLSDRENGVFITVPRAFSSAGRVLYPLTSALLFAFASVLSIIAQGGHKGVMHEISSMLVYVLLISIFSAFISCLIHKSRLLAALIPILALCSLVICPVFIDLSSYMPFIAIIRKLLLPSYYLTF